jgi:hypothetical protein
MKRFFEALRARRRAAKLRAAMLTLARSGWYACQIKVVADTHYLVRHDGLMYKVGKPIKCN